MAPFAPLETEKSRAWQSKNDRNVKSHENRGKSPFYLFGGVTTDIHTCHTTPHRTIALHCIASHDITLHTDRQTDRQTDTYQRTCILRDLTINHQTTVLISSPTWSSCLRSRYPYIYSYPIITWLLTPQPHPPKPPIAGILLMFPYLILENFQQFHKETQSLYCWPLSIISKYLSIISIWNIPRIAGHIPVSPHTNPHLHPSKPLFYHILSPILEVKSQSLSVLGEIFIFLW